MGSWAWEPVAAQLREAGELVTEVELPAHTPGRPEVAIATLDAYVERLAQAVEESGAGQVVIVGHSMAGMVISQYAERCPDRVKLLVYLAAYLPANGQSVQELAFEDTGSLLLPAARFDREAGTVGLPLDQLQEILATDCSEDMARALRDRYHDEPLAPLATPVRLTPERWGSVPKAYLFTSGDRTITPKLQHRMASAVQLARSETLRTDHTPQLSAPGEVTAALERLIH